MGCTEETKIYGQVELSDGQVVEVEVADESGERKQGLAGRESLEQGNGMLFVFTNTEYPSIWMKGMKFPIDIIFIKDQVVVDVFENVPVPTGFKYPTYQPSSPANQVLELPAGYVEQHGIKKGQEVKISVASNR